MFLGSRRLSDLGLQSRPSRAAETLKPSEDELLEVKTEDHRAHQRLASEPTVRLLMDDRERLQDADPRGFFHRVVSHVGGPRTKAARVRLRFGDFSWVAGSASLADEDCRVIGCIIERKRISDLVGRSAAGDHVRQLQKLETCNVPHAFLLLEGDVRQAESCALYNQRDEDEAGSSGHGCHGHQQDLVRCEEDIEELCLRLFVTGSCIGVMHTKDAEGTSRLLGHLTVWFELSLREKRKAILAESLRSFESSANARAHERDKMAADLKAMGVPSPAAEVIRRRFRSFNEVRTVLHSCPSALHRNLYFDFARECQGLGTRLCAAIAPDIPAVSDGQEGPGRRVLLVTASPALVARLGAPKASAEVCLQSRSSLWADEDGSCCGEFLVRANARCSETLLIAVVPGRWLVREVLASQAQLGTNAPLPAVAEAAALKLASKLPFWKTDGTAKVVTAVKNGRRLLILEGLRAAVLAEAKAISGAASSVLPQLLGTAELSSLLLDIRCGWRVRLHEARPAETTCRCLRALARVTLAEAALPRMADLAR